MLFSNDSTIFLQTPSSVRYSEMYGEIFPNICALDQLIGQRLLAHIHPMISVAHKVIRQCAKFDCLIAMSMTCGSLRLTKPNITDDKTIEIAEGRHILHEAAANRTTHFTPNNTRLSSEGAAAELIMLLNAPNAYGKSVYMKQVALIAYLAHIGCYVPARQATIARLDAIWTRIYSLDCTHHSVSSYLRDLQQMGKVMTYSSSRSLILIDEFGKGTDEHEGRALLCACLEHLLRRGALAPMTIVSTHFTGSLLASLCSFAWIQEYTFKGEVQRDGSVSPTFELIAVNSNESRFLERPTYNGMLKEMMEKKIYNSVVMPKILNAVQRVKLYMEQHKK